MLYGVSIIYSSLSSIREQEECLFEESIVVVQADDEDEARRVCELIARDNETSYDVNGGGKVQWSFYAIATVFEIQDDVVSNGTEVFSRFLRKSEVASLLTPFDD